MSWPYNQLSEAAEYVAAGIKECLDADFSVIGTEFDDERMIFTIEQAGPPLIAVTFQLSISLKDVQKAFYTGMPDISEFL